MVEDNITQPLEKEQSELHQRALTRILKIFSSAGKKINASTYDIIDKLIKIAILEGKTETEILTFILEEYIYTDRTTNPESQNPAERPIMRLRKLIQDVPNLSDLVNVAMALREKTDRKYWPNWCFIPKHVWLSILHVAQNKNVSFETTAQNPKTYDLTTRLTSIGTWRYSQGIYNFEPEIYNALLESEIPEILPSNILLQLPEWSMYIPTPKMTFYGYNVYGFFASLDVAIDDENDDITPYLFITLDTEELHTIPIPLTNENLISTIDNIIRKKTSSDEIDIIDVLGGNEMIKTMTLKTITPLLSLLLYICGNEPEIDNLKKPKTSPSNPQTRKIKGVYKVFPATNPVIWTIGKKISETLRNIDREYRGGSKIGGQKRPHFRKGHHNYYWTGPRSSEQTRILKWIPPKIVAQKTEENPEKNDKSTENTSDDA